MSVKTQHKRQRYILYSLLLLMAFYIVLSDAAASETSSPPDEGSTPSDQVATDTFNALGESLEMGNEVKTIRPIWQIYGERADIFHQMVCEKLTTTANWLDSFFRDERSEVEENTSSLRLRLSSFFEEGESVKPDARIRFRLVLPELEDRFHIMITGEQDKNDDIRDTLLDKNAEIDQEAERNVNLSLRYFIRTAKDMNFSLKVGARINNFSPVIYAGPRYRISKNIGAWLVRFTQEVKYFTDEGWESDTRFDFEKILKEDLFFRTRTEGYWFEQEYGYFYELNFSLYQVVDEDRAFQYVWNNYFETRPCHCLDQTLLGITYRRRFWRKWLFFEISPQLAFREEDDYRPTPGITFAVEALFGNREW